MNLALRATPESIGEVRVRLRRELGEILVPRALEAVCLAVGEACANVVEHAYAGLQPGPLQVSAEVAGDELRVTLRDRGHPVDPAKCKSRSLDDVRPGGLGLHFMHCAFDPVHFERDADGWNRLTLVRRLAADDRLDAC
jgi:anti-sigma regulatory factor (Ser/Thr protein kinase)